MQQYQFESVNKLYQGVFARCWDYPAISNYNGATLTYGDFARRIAEFHILYERCGLKKGDKVAICSKNQANWVVAFFSAMTYGAVPVPILHEFKPGNVHHLVNHSESRVLFVDDQIWENLNEAEMPGVVTFVQVNGLRILFSRNPEAQYSKEHITELMDEKYPGGFSAKDIDYHEDSPEELAVINYTSGTSGFSKGVMLPYRSIYGNILLGRYAHPQLDEHSNVVSILPSAHMYGLMFEIMFELAQGTHIHFLTRVPSPKIIMQAMGQVKPGLIISVPLVIEKVYKNMLKPELEKAGVKTMRRFLPGFEQVLLGKMRKSLIEGFGGQFAEIIIGGAAFNREVEAFFRKMKFPFTVGYGMTECGPIITYARWKEAKLGSAGYPAVGMEIKIDSPDPANIPGEILVHGPNVFLGYYKNEEATKEAFTDDGWFRTGDMGVIDEDGFLFIRGRNKCMILGPSGQNIYPEELEAVLNNLPYVVDSLVVESKEGLVAIVYPDFRQGEKEGLDAAQLQACVEKEIAEANKEFPNYSQIKKVEILPEDFERTPKKSIKRYLYQR